MELRYDENLMNTFPNLIKDLTLKLLHFPVGVVPASAIVRDCSIRSAFIRIFNKYIGDGTEWKVQLSSETREETLNSYRRLVMLKTSILSDDEHIISSFDTNQIPTALTDPTLDDDAELPTTLPRLRGRSMQMTFTILTLLVGAVDHLMNEVVDYLDSLFDGYRETEVTKICTFQSIVHTQNCVFSLTHSAAIQFVVSQSE